MRLFIVDDSAISRRILCAVLGDLPDLRLVGEAASGEEARARIGEARPDVVVMDWQMPGINFWPARRSGAQSATAHPTGAKTARDPVMGLGEPGLAAA